MTAHTLLGTLLSVSRHSKLSSTPPTTVTSNPKWSEILYACAENVRRMRLDYRIGGANEYTAYRVWDVSSDDGFNPMGEPERQLHVHGGIVEEFAGTAEDLCRALCHFIDGESRAMRNAGDNLTPRRVTWNLTLLDGDSKTLATRGIDWKFKPAVHEEPTRPEEDGEGQIVTRPPDDRELLLELLQQCRARIRELEEQHSSHVQMMIAGMGSLTSQSIALMESHTANALQLSQGVIATVGENFDLMKARIMVDLESATMSDDDDFMSTPMGQVVAEHIPELLKQAPSVLMAFAEWLTTVAQQKSAAG